MEAPRPEKKRRLLAGTYGREGGGQEDPQSARTQGDLAPPAPGVLPLESKGPGWGGGVQWLDHFC